MKVLHLGEETLREVSKPVEKIDENIKSLIDEMFVTVKKENGIGLAAPQVGENIRLFIKFQIKFFHKFIYYAWQAPYIGR